MRDTRRTGQTQFKAILSMSHSGTHSCTTRGHRTVHSQMFCPVSAHSPTAEVCMQQVVPNQLHIRALLSKNFFPTHLQTGCSGNPNFNSPLGLWICCLHYIPSYPVCQWVNSSFLQIEFSARCEARICSIPLCSSNRSNTSASSKIFIFPLIKP